MKSFIRIHDYNNIVCFHRVLSASYTSPVLELLVADSTLLVRGESQKLNRSHFYYPLAAKDRQYILSNHSRYADDNDWLRNMVMWKGEMGRGSEHTVCSSSRHCCIYSQTCNCFNSRTYVSTPGIHVPDPKEHIIRLQTCVPIPHKFYCPIFILRFTYVPTPDKF